MIKEDFKGIWIPREVWLSRELTMQEKIFLMEIKALDNDSGCFAGNEHFAQFSGLSKNRCSAVIKELEKKGYIYIKYSFSNETKAIDRRTIWTTGKMKKFGSIRPLPETEDPLPETDLPLPKTEDPLPEIVNPPSGNSEDSNTSSITVSNTISKTYSPGVSSDEEMDSGDKTSVTADKEKKPKKRADKRMTEAEIREKLNSEPISTKLRGVLNEYIDYRKEIGKGIKSYQVLGALISQLGRRYVDENHLIESIEAAVSCQYQGVFPLRRENRQVTKGIGSVHQGESYLARKLRELKEGERNG